MHRIGAWLNCCCRENSPTHAGEGQKSLRRGTAVIGMAPDLDPMTWDHSEIEKYGLGSGKLLLFNCRPSNSEQCDRWPSFISCS